MALADQFEEAQLLDALAWMAYSHKARVAKLANIFLQKENFISKESRNYSGPSTSNVKILIRSLFIPPRGTQQQTITDTITEIGRQRKIREARAANRPYQHPKRPPGNQPYRVERWVKGRMSAVAECRYKTLRRVQDYDTKQHKNVHCSPVIVALCRIGDCLVMVDTGNHYSNSRIYLKHRPTGREKVIVLTKDSITNFDDAMLHIAPKVSIRAMFAGSSLVLDFDGDGFLVDGVSHPYKGVIRVYTRKHDGVIKTWAKPKPKTD